MTTQIVEGLELFSEAQLESLEFLPEELENIEFELYPNLESISPEQVAKDLEAYFEGDIEAAGLEVVTRSREHRHRYPTRGQKGPAQPGTRKTNHTRINDLNSLIDFNAANRENFPAEPRNTRMPKTGMNIASSGGWVAYGRISQGRRAGVSAVITRSMIRKGTHAGVYQFPFFRRQTGILIVRGHLLARVLGGSGTNPRNLVPLYHNRNNLPMYQDIEKKIQDYVSRGGTVRFSAIPEYGKPGPLPTAITISATDFFSGAAILRGRNRVRFDTGF
jgi:DNA/RNA non-specific endonuclease